MSDRSVPTRAITPPGSGIADPGPLGLAAFALTTFVLSVFNAKLLPGTLEPVVLGLALFYGGIVQVFAGMWEFAKGNTFGATAFSSFGAFWISFWYLVTHVAPTLPPADAHRGVGIFLLGWTIFVAIMLAATPHTNGILIAVFSLLFITFVGLTIGALAGQPAISRIAGWFGLMTAFAAWYGALAGVVNGTAKRELLHTFPRG